MLRLELTFIFFSALPTEMQGIEHPGVGVRPIGWTAVVEENGAGRNEVPEVVNQVEEWRELNGQSNTPGDGRFEAQEGEGSQRPQGPPHEDWDVRRRREGRNTERPRDRYDRRDEEGSSGSPSGSELSLEEDTSAGDYHSRRSYDEDRRGRKQVRREKKAARRRERHQRRDRRRARRSQRSRSKDDEKRITIPQLLKSCSLPALKVEASHEEMRLLWPTWRDLLTNLLAMTRPASREWTEKEKYMVLMMRGGQHVHDVDAFGTTAPDERTVNEQGEVPEFTNLIKRCNAAFKPKDATMEITILRAMQQKNDESVREFLGKARKQVTLCGYKTSEERDRELAMLLKQNSIDADEISKQAVGMTLDQIEAVAVNLEALRQRRKRENKVEEKPEKTEVDVHAIWPGAQQSFQAGRGRRGGRGRPNNAQSRWPGQSSQQGEGWGRSGGSYGGGHEHARSQDDRPKCYSCGKPGHIRRYCRERGGQGPNDVRGRQRERINQVHERDENSTVHGQVNKTDSSEWRD